MRANNVIVFLTAILTTAAAHAQSERIVEWVESGSSTDPDTIALGYPVPIPVDTPLPFTGFRTYNGLHMRHQDLAATTPWVHPEQVGITRYGRPIWAYRLGDDDLLTAEGLPEQAMLSNGGIHAREWQSPEVATGIMEFIAASADDHYLVSYLRDNANVIVIPVLNIDGYLQTQRYPSSNWLGTDPDSPDFSPRDGRMRRKNLLNADEDLNTQGDHLQGVDLNRNNSPYWSTNPNRSSPDPESIVHHGPGPASEPEIQALDAAAQLGPIGRLSMYTDMHSFSQVIFWVKNSNNRLGPLTEDLAHTFSAFHRSLPGEKFYDYYRNFNAPLNQGIGSTDEYFTHTYQVPSWTLEIEPESGGTDYGGLGRNGHDGFILPDSEVPRVRSNLAQTMAIAYYQQSGPPITTALSIVDLETGAVVFESEWDAVDDNTRVLHTYQPQPLQLAHDYRIWMAHNKPMRWREDGEIAPLPGQLSSTLDIDAIASVNGEELSGTANNLIWLTEPGFAPNGYARYVADAFAFDANLPADATNVSLVDGETTMQLMSSITDMVNLRSDADPSTVARWGNGSWRMYENDAGNGNTNEGGYSSVPVQITSEVLGHPFVVEAGTSSAWYDPARDGEGFMLEILPGNRAVMYWFTYDSEGEQDWYIAVGDVDGNRVLFPELLQISGGVFGPDFDPDAITETVVGSASFIWSGCDTGTMKWQMGTRRGRMQLARLSTIMGIECGDVLPPALEEARLSGSWYDPTHNGEGYTLEVLIDQRVLVYWFGFGPDGHRRWFFGLGSIAGDVFEFPEMLTSKGAIFGPDFDPDDVQILPWGSLELEISCEGGEARFSPTETGFPSGTLELDRLRSLQDLDC
jgi:hypothetical protein